MPRPRSSPLNTWWVADPAQRYWMQITDRTDLDGPLLSPKLSQLRWGYDLVSQVQPGDRVLHWRAVRGEGRAADRLVRSRVCGNGHPRVHVEASPWKPG